MAGDMEDPPLSRSELIAAFLILAAAGAFLLRDLFQLHPAYAAIDESFCVIDTQLFLEGRALSFMAGTGSLLHCLQWLSVLAAGTRLSSLHLAVLLGILAEGFLLWRLTQRLAGRRAALGALLFNFICAFSLMRARSLLSFAMLPCELLLVLNLMLPDSSSLSCFLAGLLAGLFTLDYEGWIFGAVIVAALSLAGFQGAGRKTAILSGLMLGVGISLWISRDEWMSWYLVRRSYSSQGPSAMLGEFTSNLRSFFMGGETVAYLGVDQHPSVPFWGMPFLVLGLWKAKGHPWIWPWLALGLLPLAATSYSLEPNRAIAAWPALALLAGLGYSATWNLLQAKISPGLVALFFAALLITGFADEAAAYAKSMFKNYPLYYGRSEARMQAGVYLCARSQEEGLRLISNLSLSSGAELRFDASGLKSSPRASVVAWIHDDDIRSFNRDSGSWTLFQPFKNVAPERLLNPSAQWSTRLESIDQQLEAFERTLTMYDARGNQAAIFAWLDAHPQADPWVRTALWAKVMNYASLSGDIPEARLENLLSENLQSTAPLFEPGVLLLHSHPDDALRMLKKAKALDPRRELNEAIYSKIQALAAANTGKNR